MDYILSLKRFTLSIEQLTKKLHNCGTNINLAVEENHYLLHAETIDLAELARITEIDTIYQLTTDWKAHSFPVLRQDCLNALQDRGVKTYKIKTKFYHKIPLSAKSVYHHVNPYVKHEGFIPNEEAYETVLYIEFKKELGKILYRVSIQPQEAIKTIVPYQTDMSKLNVLIEEPELVSEIGDFLRVCYIFKLPLFILSVNPNIEKMLAKAQEETKGLNEGHFTVTIVNELPKNYATIAFTKHSPLTETKLPELFQMKKKILLLFGNDKYGLSQHVRDQAEHQIRLTPELKKPLRGSQALSYLLGIYTGKQL